MKSFASGGALRGLVAALVLASALLVSPGALPARAQQPPAPPVATDPAAVERQRQEQARADAERRESERLEAQRLEAERVERERIEREQREAERTSTLAARLRSAGEELAESERGVLAALGERNRVSGEAVVARYDLDDARARLAASDERIAEATRALEQARLDLATEQDTLAEQAARAYRAGSTARNAPMAAVDALLETASPGHFVAGMTYLDSVLGHAVDRVESAAAAIAQLERDVGTAERARLRAEQDIAAAEVALAAAGAALPAREARLAGALATSAARSTALVRFAAAERAATMQGLAHPSRAENVRLADEITAVARAAAQAVERMRAGSARIAAGADGVRPWRELACPVDGAVHFSNDWGFPRSGGRSHEGTDVFAERGTPIVAIAEGVVRRISHQDIGLGGLSVTYDVDGHRIYNAHLDRVAEGLGVGDRVTRGQVIGTVGTSGNAAHTPPHNHFGVHRPDGAPVNPFPLLRRACG